MDLIISGPGIPNLNTAVLNSFLVEGNGNFKNIRVLNMQEKGYSLAYPSQDPLFNKKKLNSEQLGTLLETIGDKTEKKEKRFFKRSFHFDELVVEDSEEFFHIKDVSLSGIGIETDKDYDLGKKMKVVMKVWKKIDFENVEATVVRKEKTSKGYSYGLNFPKAFLD